MDIFAQQVINGLVLGSVYALVALGYTMVYGILGLINFAHGEVVMIDAMVRADSVDPEVYLPSLKSTDYQGVTGQIRFDERGDLQGGSISLYRVSDGEWEYIETVGGGS